MGATQTSARAIEAGRRLEQADHRKLTQVIKGMGGAAGGGRAGGLAGRLRQSCSSRWWHSEAARVGPSVSAPRQPAGEVAGEVAGKL
jgi:hypothetical protein